MKLKHLKHGACPHCAARILSEHQTHQHCNGEWFETQIFACGHGREYTPNFQEEREIKPCPCAPAELDRKTRQLAALDKLRKYINKLDVDDAFKKSLMSYWPV